MQLHLFAYLDLASGSMIVQAAIAGCGGVPSCSGTRSAGCWVVAGRPTSPRGEATATSVATPDPSFERRVEGSDTSRP